MLMLTKMLAELLASVLRQRGLLQDNVKVTYYRDRDKELHYLFEQTDEAAFMKNIAGFFEWMNLSISEQQGQWRVFIDSSMRSLKAVLLHNGSLYPEVPIFFSRTLAEGYETLKHLLEKINYNDLSSKFKFKICGDFKVINIIRGLQSGNVGFPCIYCRWNSRKADHQYGAAQPAREAIEIGRRATRSSTGSSKKNFNQINEPLVELDDILLPPLHIGLGLFSQLIKSVFKRRPREDDEETYYELNCEQLIEHDDQENDQLMEHLYEEGESIDEAYESSEPCDLMDIDPDDLMDMESNEDESDSEREPEAQLNFKGKRFGERELVDEIMTSFPKVSVDDYELVKFLKRTFKFKSNSKLENGIFNGPEIRRLIQLRDQFEATMQPKFKAAWLSYVELCQGFLGSERSDEWQEIARKLVSNYKEQGCLMSLKLHYVSDHLDKFPANCGLMSEQQGERFHQQLSWLEKFYNKSADGLRMLADFCWRLRSQTDWSILSRKPNRRMF